MTVGTCQARKSLARPDREAGTGPSWLLNCIRYSNGSLRASTSSLVTGSTLAAAAAWQNCPVPKESPVASTSSSVNRQGIKYSYIANDELAKQKPSLD